ncbi:winged helix-turn-helix domain-containing protein, partial [Dyella silvatica]|uniref:nSTAND1 domain-containing NTPase n=1 Tax=Dyella silvatica TaxID=2992128 RepID=UPI002258A378
MARQRTTAGDYFRLGDWIVKPEQRLLQRGEQSREISARSMDALVHLAEHAGEVVSAEQLLIECWRGTFYGDNPVHKAIAELRKQLGDHAQSPDFIMTIRKRGYRLIAPVSFPENFTAASARSSTTWADGSPFRGLQPFDARHAPVFFGRSGATAQILQALREQYEAGCAFVLCMGPSGCGKTSLIRAGVLPLLLQRGGFDGMEACSVAEMASMGNDAIGALAHAMLAWQVDQRPVFLPAELAMLTEQLESEPEVVAARAVAALSRRQPSAPSRAFIDGVLVLVVDALEGMFADALSDETQMTAFIRVLDAFARSGGVLVIATCRNDFYPRLVKLPVLIELKQGAGLYDVKPMTRGEIAQMIRRPAHAAALTFARDPGTQELLDDAIRDAAIRHPESLPLLQYTLQELYARRSDSGVLSFDAYREIGGLEGALGVRAEAIFQQLGSAAQSALPWLLQRLIQIHADDEGVTGRRVAWSQLDTRERRHLVEGLVDARLLVSELAIDAPVVSVAHEALLRHWPRVVDWVNGNRVALQVRARLTTVVQRWQREARRRDLLLPRGRLLDEAYALLGNPVVLLADDELAFIRTSHRYVQWAQRARVLMIGLIVLLGLAAVVAAQLAVRAQHDAERRRGAAEDLIGFMLGDLSERLKPLGRLDLLDRVSSEALSYLADAESKESVQRKDSRDSDRNASLHRAKALMQLGDIRLARADREHARTAFSHALEVLQQLHANAPADTEILAELGKANFWIGLIDFRQRDLLHAGEAWERYRSMATMRMTLE